MERNNDLCRWLMGQAIASLTEGRLVIRGQVPDDIIVQLPVDEWIEANAPYRAALHGPQPTKNDAIEFFVDEHLWLLNDGGLIEVGASPGMPLGRVINRVTLQGHEWYEAVRPISHWRKIQLEVGDGLRRAPLWDVAQTALKLSGLL